MESGAAPVVIAAAVPAGSGVGGPGLAGEDERRLRMEFTGTGEEYFRIWLVDLLLTVLPLGICSAWAKVRRLKYFHQNARLPGSAFNYHGNPVAILKGRFIALFNLLRISSTLGFDRPFAVIRTLKYRIKSVSLLPDGDLDSFVVAAGTQVAAFGKKAADLFDFAV